MILACRTTSAGFFLAVLPSLLGAAAAAGLAGCDYLPLVGRAEAEIVGKGADGRQL